ncbi:MAG: RNA polymerase sigma-70 factor [Gemmatimonadaceae bacterium]
MTLDDAAFEALFRAHYAPLCEFVYGYVGVREAAEELVQDVFFGVWTRRERWEPSDSARAYLYGAARNRALNHLRNARATRHRDERAGAEEAAPAMGAPAPDAAARIEREETAAAVRRAIAALPERARLAVTLRWEHGLRYAEVAEVMGISTKGVERLLTRAMTALRAGLGEGG